MKQVIQSMRGGELRVADVPAPLLRPEGVLVRTRVSLVSSGTERMVLELARKSLAGKARARPDLVEKVLAKVKRDGLQATMTAAMNRLDMPVPLGYACAGEVVEAGARVGAELGVGTRVACAGAGYANHAELNYVPGNLVVPLPEGLDWEAAAFANVGAIALHGVRTADPRLGESAAVVGLGLIGLLTVQLLRAGGVRVLGVDPSPERVALARTLGAEAAVTRQSDPEGAARALSGGRGVDHVLICAATDSNDPVTLAGRLARDRGVITIVGAVAMDVPRRPYYDKELQLRLSRSTGPGRYDATYEEGGHDYPFAYVRWTERRNLASFLDFVASGAVKVTPLVTHRFAIERADDAYAIVSGERPEPHLAILLRYPDAAPAVRRRVELGGAPPVAPRATGDRVRIGVVGTGAFARGVLLPALARTPYVELRTACSAQGVSARHVAERYGFAAAATDPREVWDDPAIDAVVIATRHAEHAAQALAALRAGKHVFVEKPLALTHGELAALAEAARASRGLLTVGFNRRFAPLAVALRTALAARAPRGPLTFVYRVNAGALDAASWHADPALAGERVVGEGCHFIDLVTYLAGAPPVRVHAEPQADGALLSLRLADGSAAAIAYATGGDPALPKERLEVLGRGLSAVLDDWRSLDVWEGGAHRREGGAPGPLAALAPAQQLFASQDKGHAAELRAFVDACRAGGPPPIALDALLAVSLASLEAVASARDGAPRAVDLDALVGHAADAPAPDGAAEPPRA